MPMSFPRWMRNREKGSSLQTILDAIKIIASLSVAGGALWSIIYFAMIGVLPDFDASTLAAYLVAIFLIGLFAVVFLMFIINSPAIFYRMFLDKEWDSKEGIEAEFKGLISSWFVLIIVFAIAINQSPRNPTINICILIFTWILPILYIAIFRFTQWEPKGAKWYAVVPNVLLRVTFGFYAYWVAVGIFAFIVVIPDLQSGKGFVIFFGFVAFLIAIINLVFIRGDWKLLKSTSPFCVGIPKSALQLANMVLGGGVGFLIVIVASIMFNAAILNSSSSNALWFIKSPFYMLKLGQYRAQLELEKSFAESMKDAGFLDIPESKVVDVFVFSSIGREYVVVPHHLLAKSNNGIENVSSPGKTIEKEDSIDRENWKVRIPKSAVLAVKYLDGRSPEKHSKLVLQ